MHMTAYELSSCLVGSQMCIRDSTCSWPNTYILPKSVKKVGDQALRTNSTVETITFEGEEAPELTGNPFPFKENILKIMVPSGKSEAYKAKWGSYEGYHSKIEERS
uniref:hypothetical protein n=1 Tax=Phocaeicola plebeius TaxID=310297 RepID=UPI003FD8C1ED